MFYLDYIGVDPVSINENESRSQWYFSAFEELSDHGIHPFILPMYDQGETYPFVSVDLHTMTSGILANKYP